MDGLWASKGAEVPPSRLYDWDPRFGDRLLEIFIRRVFGALKGLMCGLNAFTPGNIFSGITY